MYGYRHGQEQVVILREVQSGICVEHTAERSEEHCKQAEKREIHPVESERHERTAQIIRKGSEHYAEDSDHYRDEHDDISDDSSL